jgi:PIN domain
LPINYVLVDFENVQPENIGLIASGNYKLVVFVGASQTKVSFDIAETIQRLGAKAEYVKISGNGSNALDFHIAFYIGHISATEVGAKFCIVSKDAGFDPLIAHLKLRKVAVSRVKSILELPEFRSKKQELSKIEQVLARLIQMKASKPRTLKTLTTTISALFGKQLTDQELSALIQELSEKGNLQIDGAKIAYSLQSET